MRILLTNDDGINAPGLRCLIEIASKFSDDIWVVAPEVEQSGAGHSLSLRRPLRIETIAPTQFCINGTPTDCVLLALKEIMQDNPPDLLFSGVNRGANIGKDITYSGTIAAAMEGALFSIPSIALSQTCARDETPPWDVPTHYAHDVIKQILSCSIPEHTLINVNFPNTSVEEVKGVKVTPQGLCKLGERIYKNHDPEGVPYYWISTTRNTEGDKPNSDFAAVGEGYISVTPIQLDLTHYDMVSSLDKALSCSFSHVGAE